MATETVTQARNGSSAAAQAQTMPQGAASAIPKRGDGPRVPAGMYSAAEVDELLAAERTRLNFEPCTTTPGEAARQAARPRFQRFERYRTEVDKAEIRGDVVRRFVEKVADIAGGAQTIIEMTMDDHQRTINRGDADDAGEDDVGEDRPLLSCTDLWNLQRMAARALDMLDSEASRVMDWAYEYRTPEGRDQRGRDR